MKQDHVHQYVLEHIAGLGAQLRYANQIAKTIATISILLTVGIMATTIFSGNDFDSGMQLALATLVAGFPFGILAQRYTARKVLHRNNLQITSFLIGKKEYLVPAHGTLSNELDIFAAASSLVGSSTALKTTKHAAAWHTYQVVEEENGVAVCLGWYGPEGKPYAFIYGDTKSVTKITSEVWDLGHIRQVHENDINFYATTAKSWRSQSTLPVAIAFAPLPAKNDFNDIKLADIKQQSTLLGLLQLKGTRSDYQTFSPQLSSAMRTAAQMQLVTSLSLLILIFIAFIGSLALSLPPVIGLLQVAVISVALLPLILSSISWDSLKHHTHKISRKQLSDALSAVGLLVTISISQFLLYISRSGQGLQEISAYSIAHNSAVAAIGATIIGCLLIEIFIRRQQTMKINLDSFNPFFMLAFASSLLIAAIITFTTGPLTDTDYIFLIGGVAAYLIIRSLQLYALRHHTREHIIELLTQR